MMTKMNQAKTMLMSILSAAILLLGLSACSAGEFDNPVSNNPLGNQVADVCKQANDADRTHFTELYDSQVARMQAVNHWMATTPICDNSIQTRYQLGGGMAFDWTSESVTG